MRGADAARELVARAFEGGEVEQTRRAAGGAAGLHRDRRVGARGDLRQLTFQPGDLRAQRLPRGERFVEPGEFDHRHAVNRILDLVPRNDPSDTGGLFIGRRPGTGPVHYRGAPERGGAGRQRTDGLLAAGVLVLEMLLCLSVWGPQPAAWLWVGSQVNYWSGSVFLGIVVAFFGVMATLFLTLALCTRLDRVWRLLRRAAGHDQREGVLGRIFGFTAIVALVVFGFWFVVIQGPGPELAPR